MAPATLKNFVDSAKNIDDDGECEVQFYTRIKSTILEKADDVSCVQ